MPVAFAVFVIDVIKPGVAHADVFAFALGRHDHGAVFAALRNPYDVGHAAEEQAVGRFDAPAFPKRIAPIHAVVGKFIIYVAAGFADDLIYHDVSAVAHLRHNGHPGAHGPVGDGNGVPDFAPVFAAVRRSDERQSLVEPRVGMGAFVRKSDRQVSFLSI